MEIKKIYILGICGTAMAPLAGILKEKGFTVRGSDSRAYPPMSDMLRELNIEIDIGYFPGDIHEFKPDLVIIGNVIRRDNPQAIYVFQESIPYMSFPQALKEFLIGDKLRFVVAGTHGKSTTSSILVSVLKEAKLDPGYLIGAIPKGENKSFHISKSDYFVIEGDEYDTAFFDKRPKFLHYEPKYLIITSLEFDHADIYRNVSEIKSQFKKLVDHVPSDGKIVYCSDWQELRDVFCVYDRGITYGRRDAAWTIDHVHYIDGRMHFDVYYRGSFYDRFCSPLFGEHNALNCLGVIALCSELGLGRDVIKKGISVADGVRRRLELKGVFKGIHVYDDFAHHPTAISETLHALRMIHPDKRIIAVYEPRSNTSRRNVFQSELPHAFKDADIVMLKEIYEPHQIPVSERLDVSLVADTLNSRNKTSYVFSHIDGILDKLCEVLQENDVVVIMSNGDFDGLCERLIGVLGRDSKL